MVSLPRALGTAALLLALVLTEHVTTALVCGLFMLAVSGLRRSRHGDGSEPAASETSAERAQPPGGRLRGHLRGCFAVLRLLADAALTLLRALLSIPTPNPAARRLGRAVGDEYGRAYHDAIDIECVPDAVPTPTDHPGHSQ